MKSLLFWNGFVKKSRGVWENAAVHVRVCFDGNHCFIEPIGPLAVFATSKELWDGGRDKAGRPAVHPLHSVMYERLLGWMVCCGFFDVVLVPNFHKTANDKLMAERRDKWLRKQKYNCMAVQKKMERFAAQKGLKPDYRNAQWTLTVFSQQICGSLEPVVFDFVKSDGKNELWATLAESGRMFLVPTVENGEAAMVSQHTEQF